MKTFNKMLIVLCMIAALASGQTALTTTTLSTAMTSSQSTVTLTSATGVTAQGPGNAINTVVYVDRELMWVTTLVSGTTYNVQRGKNQTRQVSHAALAKVYLGNPTGNFFANNGPDAETWGSCLMSNEPTLPKLYVTTGDVFQCYRTGAAGTAGQWVKIANGTMAQAGTRISGFCTGTVGSNENAFLNGAACSGATTATARQVITTTGTLANLYVYSSAVVVAMGSDPAYVYLNGSATALTCTMAAGATTCQDLTHSVKVVPGDVVTFFFDSTASDSAANISMAVGLY